MNVMDDKELVRLIAKDSEPGLLAYTQAGRST